MFTVDAQFALRVVNLSTLPLFVLLQLVVVVPVVVAVSVYVVAAAVTHN